MRTLALALLIACHTDPKDTATDDTGLPDGEGFCPVQSILADNCTICHDGSDPSGGLDLETDPWAALVNAPSQYGGRTLVVPGDPAGSFLMDKLEGTQASGEGDSMPPSGFLSAGEIDIVMNIRALGKFTTPNPSLEASSVKFSGTD